MLIYIAIKTRTNLTLLILLQVKLYLHKVPGIGFNFLFMIWSSFLTGLLEVISCYYLSNVIIINILKMLYVVQIKPYFMFIFVMSYMLIDTTVFDVCIILQ